MMTVGPHHIDVMSLYDWTTLVQFAETRTNLEPFVLRALALDGEKVEPQDLASELDDLHFLVTHNPEGDTSEISELLEALLARLKAAGIDPA